MWANSLAAAPLAVADSAGNRVVLAQPAQRIVTLSPHAAELVAAAGALSQLVAVSAFSDNPEAVRQLPIAGNASSLDIERIYALKPDLIVAPSYLPPAQRKRLSDFALFIADAGTPEAIADEIEAIGVLAGHAEEALASAQQLRARLKTIRRTAADEKPLKVFYVIWNAPLYTTGGGTLIDQAITFCGGRNIFADVRTSAPVVSQEAVIQAAPDVIVFGASENDFASWKQDWQRWTQVPAVRNQNLVRINPDFLHRPGPRFVDGMEALCREFEQARVRRR